MANTYTDQLKMRMPEIGDLDWGDEVNDNVQIVELGLAQVLKGNAVVSGLVASDGGGLQVDYTAGSAVINGTSYDISASNKTCAASTKNWLYVDNTGTVQISITAPTGNFAMIALIDAGSTALDRIGDMRNLAESILSLDITYSPDNYTLDSGESSEIEQHLAGIDNQIGFIGGFRNKIINGCFRNWQRGTSQTSSGLGSDDMWRNSHNGSTKTHSQQAFTLGQTDVPGEPEYFSRTVVTSSAGATNFVSKYQRIESVRTLAGKNAVVRFWAKADASKNIAIEIMQSFGTGGSPSSYVIADVETVALTSNWQKIEYTVDMPPISGKTIGTNGDDFIQFNIWFDAGSDYNSRTNSLGQQSGTFDISEIGFYEGEVAPPPNRRSNEEEISLCQRYYQMVTTNNDSCLTLGQTTAGAAYYKTEKLSVEMRAAPSLTGLGFAESGVGFNGRTISDVTFNSFNGSAFLWYLTASNTNTGTNMAWVKWEASADL